MSFGELWEKIWPYLVTVLGTGGGLTAFFKWWIDRRDARNAAETAERSRANEEQTIDRQKLTQEIYGLFRETEAAADLLRKEQLTYERQLAKANGEKDKAERDRDHWMQVAIATEAQNMKLKAEADREKRAREDCERRWQQFLDSTRKDERR